MNAYNDALSLGIAKEQAAAPSPTGGVPAVMQELMTAGLVSGAPLTSTGRTRESLAQADLVVGSLGELSPQRIGKLIAERGGPS